MIKDCDKCGNKGWRHTDSDPLMDAKFWTYCSCEHAARLRGEDEARYIESQLQTCPTCKGSGKIMGEKIT